MGGPVLITGNSSGLGRGLQEVCLERGWLVYGMSRRGSGVGDAELREAKIDLTDHSAVPETLGSLLEGAEGLDLVILNHGILGRMEAMPETSTDELRWVMEVNVWCTPTTSRTPTSALSPRASPSPS